MSKFSEAEKNAILAAGSETLARLDALLGGNAVSEPAAEQAEGLLLHTRGHRPAKAIAPTRNELAPCVMSALGN